MKNLTLAVPNAVLSDLRESQPNLDWLQKSGCLDKLVAAAAAAIKRTHFFDFVLCDNVRTAYFVFLALCSCDILL